jgi:hypothetical protein
MHLSLSLSLSLSFSLSLSLSFFFLRMLLFVVFSDGRDQHGGQGAVMVDVSMLFRAFGGGLCA